MRSILRGCFTRGREASSGRCCQHPRRTRPPHHQQCDVNYREIRRPTVWSYEFHRIIDGRVPSPEGMRPYEKLPIPTDPDIVHITLLVAWMTSEFLPPTIGFSQESLLVRTEARTGPPRGVRPILHPALTLLEFLEFLESFLGF